VPNTLHRAHCQCRDLRESGEVSQGDRRSGAGAAGRHDDTKQSHFEDKRDPAIYGNFDLSTREGQPKFLGILIETVFCPRGSSHRKPAFPPPTSQVIGGCVVRQRKQKTNGCVLESLEARRTTNHKNRFDSKMPTFCCSLAPRNVFHVFGLRNTHTHTPNNIGSDRRDGQTGQVSSP